jgi:hypothetical protein
MTPRQPQFSITVTYKDDQPPGYHAGTWKAVTKWLGAQQNVADAQIGRAGEAPVQDS